MKKVNTCITVWINKIGNTKNEIKLGAQKLRHWGQYRVTQPFRKGNTKCQGYQHETPMVLTPKPGNSNIIVQFS